MLALAAMKRRRDNIFLVGPMGAGKTTIGKRVAEELGLTFYDLDNEIESRTGADVRLIFDIEGEDGFRKRETAMLEDLTSRTGVLVATGGGAVLAKENRRQLIRNGTVVYLHVPLERLAQRLERDKKRPLLEGDDRKARLEELQQTREPLYREVADLIIETHQRNVPSMARFVTKRICEYRDGNEIGNA